MPSGRTPKIATGRTDWAALRAMSDADIDRAADEDEGNPTTDQGHRAHAAIGPSSGKTAIHASFDRDVVEFFESDGRRYQTRMNAVLRRYMEAQQAKKPSR
jgi:uncharacterized protein (DUF4415 family)